MFLRRACGVSTTLEQEFAVDTQLSLRQDNCRIGERTIHFGLNFVTFRRNYKSLSMFSLSSNSPNSPQSFGDFRISVSWPISSLTCMIFSLIAFSSAIPAVIIRNAPMFFSIFSVSLVSRLSLISLSLRSFPTWRFWNARRRALLAVPSESLALHQTRAQLISQCALQLGER